MFFQLFDLPAGAWKRYSLSGVPSPYWSLWSASVPPGTMELFCQKGFLPELAKPLSKISRLLKSRDYLT